MLIRSNSNFTIAEGINKHPARGLNREGLESYYPSFSKKNERIEPPEKRGYGIRSRIVKKSNPMSGL